jgi:hypothetical protein
MITARVRAALSLATVARLHTEAFEECEWKDE